MYYKPPRYVTYFYLGYGMDMLFCNRVRSVPGFAHYNDVIMSTMASQITSLSLLNRSFRRRSKKTSKPHVTGRCEGNPPVPAGFPSQRASNVESISIWWHDHALHVIQHAMPSLFDVYPNHFRGSKIIVLIWNTDYPDMQLQSSRYVTWIVQIYDLFLIEK